MKRKRRIKVNFIIIIAVILIVLGVSIIFFANDNKSVKKVSKTLTNDSTNLLSTHCLNDLCVNSMDITYNKGQGEIEFVLRNNSQVLAPSNYLKIVFDKNADLSYIYRYDDINPLDSVNVVIEFQEKELLDISDYEIKELSTRELNEFKEGEQGSSESE